MHGRTKESEHGAYLVMYALLGVAFFTMAAVVLDIAALRQGRRADRTAADLAATAGVTELAVNDPSSFAGACEAAWGYVLANRTDDAGAVTAPDCSATFPSVACTSTMAARTATGTTGQLTIEITHPVPDGSPLMLAEAQGGDVAQPIDPPTDGTSCERLGVRIVRTRTFLFGQVAGVLGGSTDVHSVARALTATSTTEVPAVVALEPTACGALVTDPNSGALEMGSAAQAGIAVVDSAASGCAAGTYAIEAGAVGDPPGRIVAVSAGATTGQIRSYALSQSTFASAYDPAAAGTRINPTPTPALTRTGRALVDNRYKCPSCGASSNPVGELEADRSAGMPAGASLYTGPCTVAAPGIVITGASHVYVDCPDFVVDTDVTFLGTSLTVNGNVSITDQGCLAVNDSTCNAGGIVSQDADVFVRGTFTKSIKGRAALPRTLLYTRGALQVGVDPDTTIGNSTLLWSAPTLGDFEDLLFWSESSAPMVLGEQKNVSLEGTLVAPNAPLALNPRDGGAGVTTTMQVISRTLRVSGDGTFRLQPTPDRATGSLTRQVRLIR